jgi:hypothetical protein
MGPPVRIGGLLLTTAATKLITDPHEYVCVEQGSPRTNAAPTLIRVARARLRSQQICVEADPQERLNILSFPRHVLLPRQR